MQLWVDLHLHTVLSACAEIEMIPPLIVQKAQQLGLDMIAVTDHNCTANVRAVIQAAKGTGMIVLPGIEVQTREEVHLICLFDTPEQADAYQDIVSAALPDRKNNERLFGAQYAVDHTGEYLYTESRLLSTSTSLSIEQAAEKTNELNGICLPAHIDRPSFSILNNLGFIPPELPIAGIELSHLTSPQKFVKLFPTLAPYGMLVNGDAHRLSEMIARTLVQVEKPTIKELEMALAKQGGRSVTVTEPPPLDSP